jgi:hypothetical protein
MQGTYLKKYFKNEESYVNLMAIYLKFKQRKELDMLNYIRGIFQACIEANNNGGECCWLKPDDFFSECCFNEAKIISWYRGKVSMFFGKNIFDFTKKLV